VSDFVSQSDIKDKMLSQVGSSDDYLEADQYIYDLALRRGVLVADVKKGSETQFTVKRLAVAYVCMIRAQRNSGINPERYEAGIRDDAYWTKYQAYAQEVSMLTNSVTKEMLTGVADTPNEFAFNPFKNLRG
jgi:hypothetical protein